MSHVLGIVFSERYERGFLEPVKTITSVMGTTRWREREKEIERANDGAGLHMNWISACNRRYKSASTLIVAIIEPRSNPTLPLMLQVVDIS